MAEHNKDVGAFFLPSYSPERNPDERLNADLKRAIGTKISARTKVKLHAAASQRMQLIQANPQRVRAYFQDLIVRYAA